jgi:hypothetical protein
MRRSIGEEKVNLLGIQRSFRILFVCEDKQNGVLQLILLILVSGNPLKGNLTSNIAINSCFATPSLSESQLSTTKIIASVFG